MARFIGSDLHTDNWGEDYFIEKLMEYDEYIESDAIKQLREQIY